MSDPADDSAQSRMKRSKLLRNSVQTLLSDEDYVRVLQVTEPDGLSRYIRDLIKKDLASREQPAITES